MPSSTSCTLAHVTVLVMRWAGGSSRGPRWPTTSPVTTAATRPDAPSASAGTEAMNGSVKDSTVFTLALEMRRRSVKLPKPTSSPIASATATDHRNDPTVSHSEKPAAVATIAVRRSTSAVASLNSDSPSRIVTTRPGTPRPLMIEVATASVGERIAPSASPHRNPSPGMSQLSSRPMSTELATTRGTARPLIAERSRRKDIDGIATAPAYSSGGRITSMTSSGSISSVGMPGIRLATMPSSTSSSGAATFRRGARTSAAQMVMTTATPAVMAAIIGRRPCGCCR